MKKAITITVTAPEEDAEKVIPAIEHALNDAMNYPWDVDATEWDVLVAEGTDRIGRFGEVVPGDQVLSDDELLTVESVRVGEDPRYPGFPVAFITGTGESGRGVALSPPANGLTAIRSKAAVTHGKEEGNG